MDKLTNIETFDAKVEATENYLQRLRKWCSDRIYYRLAKRINWLLGWFYDDGGLKDIPYIDFDIEYEDGCYEGRLQWNSEDGSLEVGMPGGNVCLQIGQEVLVRAKNTSGSQIDNGSVVYVTGATGSRPTIGLADADDFLKSVTTFAIATEDIPNNQFGYVTNFGIVRDVDTSAFSDGDLIYLSNVAGEFTDTPPDPPAFTVGVGIVLLSHASEGIIGVRIEYRSQYPEIEWDDLRIVPGSFQRAGSSDPTLSDWQPGGSGTTFKVYKFSKNDEVFASVQMPHGYKEGTDLQFHIHWTPCDRGNEEIGNAVGWKVDHSIANVNGTFPSSSTVDLSDTVTGTDDKHEITSSVTVSGTGLTISHMIVLRIYRSDTGTDDTWVGNTAATSPAILEFDIHFEKNTGGSRTEFAK